MLAWKVGACVCRYNEEILRLRIRKINEISPSLLTSFRGPQRGNPELWPEPSQA